MLTLARTETATIFQIKGPHEKATSIIHYIYVTPSYAIDQSQQGVHTANEINLSH